MAQGKNEGRGLGLSGLGGVMLGALCGVLGPAGSQARVSVALLLVLAALILVACVPAVAARGRPALALRGAASFLLGVLLGGGLFLPAVGLALGALYLALLTVPLAAVAARLGEGPGALVASGGGLALLALPYFADPLLLGLGDGGALGLVLASPLPALSGTFAGVDVLRTSTLYGLFAPGQALGYAYPAPWVVLLPALALALGAGVALRRPGWRPDRRVLAALALLLVLGAPGQEAQAQVIPNPSLGSGEPEIGDLNTRVVLGYWAYPEHGGRVVLDSQKREGGSRFSFERTMDLNRVLVLPTFEITFGWQNAGGITIQYIEAQWEGEIQTKVPLRLEETIFQPLMLLETRYRWRTIALRGELDIPVFDWVSAKIVTTQRYVKHELRVRGFGPSTAVSVRNSFEGLVPTLGGGVDVLIWNVISAYGDLQWLDFTTSLFGAEDKRLTYKYREWRLGIRFELVEHAHIMAEWYSIETMVREGFGEFKEEYRQDLSGVRVQVAVLF